MRKQNTFQSNLLKWLGGVKAKSEIGGYREEEGMGFILMSQKDLRQCVIGRSSMWMWKKKLEMWGRKTSFTASCHWVLLISIIWTLHSGNSNEAHITVYTPSCLIILPPPNTVVPTKHRLTWKPCTFVTNNGHFVNLEIWDACCLFVCLFVLIKVFDQSQLFWKTREISFFNFIFYLVAKSLTGI